MGIQGYPVASEFLDSELQWSTFEKMEAQSKLGYFGRISVMPHNRWPRAILTMMETLDCKSVTYKREDELRKLYRCTDIRIQLKVRGEPQLTKFNNAIETRVTSVRKENLRKSVLRREA